MVYCRETLCKPGQNKLFFNRRLISVSGWVGSMYFQLQKVVGVLFGERTQTSLHGKGKRRMCVASCPSCCCSSRG